MKVIQILPELNSGGVERGTLEIGAALVAAGHQSIVISNGGRLVKALEADGSRHISMPVHHKGLAVLLEIGRMRRLFKEEKPDIVHVRSRLPAWIAWLAWRGMDTATRPHFVSTVHGCYSVCWYSAIMTKGARVIAVSSSIRDYIRKNYPKTDPEIIRVIPRGVLPPGPGELVPDPQWLDTWRREQTQLEGKKVLLLPGRITRWKGQKEFIQLVAGLRDQGRAVHGLMAGETHFKKRDYMDELHVLIGSLKLGQHITFLGHRSDVRQIMQVSDVVFSLSSPPEAFGRVSLEAMAMGVPVVGYEHGGVAEQLAAMYPRGKVPVGDTHELLKTTVDILDHPDKPATVAPQFTLEAMCRSTLGVYEELLRTETR